MLEFIANKISEEPRILFPILALVFAQQEVVYLMFHLPKKLEREPRLNRQQLLQVNYGQVWRRWISVILITNLSIALIISMFDSRIQDDASMYNAKITGPR